MKDYDRWRLFFDTQPRSCFDVLVPRTMAKMEQGLQRFPPPGAGEGMLFLSRAFPQEEAIPLWMAKVAVPLDMVFLGRGSAVVHVQANVQPGDKKTYEHRCVAVLEVRGGTCAALGIRRGTSWTY